MIDNKLGIYILLGGFPIALISSANQAKYIDFVPFFCIYSHFLIGELPAVGDISFATNPAFIAIK